MTIKSGTGQACAACKFQRRRCTPECLLAPFFPADQPKIFHSVHRLFGVKNIQNLLRELGPDQKAMAMKSIKFHAAMRDKYPVYGCLVDIHQLTYQIQAAEEELHAVLQQLAYYKHAHLSDQIAPDDDYLSELQLGVAPPGNNNNINNDNSSNNIHDNDHHHHHQNNIDNNLPLYSNGFAVLPNNNIAPAYSNSGNTDHFGINYFDFKENINAVDSFCQETYGNDNNMRSQLIVQDQTAQDYEEVHRFFDHIDDTQSYIGSKEACESSLESPLKDSRQFVEQMDENELKSAAACFSLTSVN